MKSVRFRRIRPKAKEKSFALKDWVLTAISVIAFTVSMATFYLNYVRRTDLLSIVVSTLPEIEEQDEGKGLELVGDEMGLILVNGGTRPAVILSISLYVLAIESGQQEVCKVQPPVQVGEEPTYWHFDTEFDPIIVKSSEVISSKIRLKAAQVRQMTLKKMSARLTLTQEPDDFEPSGKFTVLACLLVFAATPSTSFMSNVQADRREVKYGGEDSGYFISYRFPFKRPMEVYRQSGVALTD